MVSKKKTANIDRIVDDNVHPFFGVDTAELVALRKLADAVEGDECDLESLQELVTVIRKIQTKKHAN